MLKQMLGDDKTEDVRESVVKSLALLMAFIDEPDKFSQVRHDEYRGCIPEFINAVKLPN